MKSETLQILDLTDKLINKDEEIAALKAENERKERALREVCDYLYPPERGFSGSAYYVAKQARSEEG